MEQPFIGKRADVLNKQGVVAFFNKKTELAVSLWEQAIKLSEGHFDALTNYSMFLWPTGQISDN